MEETENYGKYYDMALLSQDNGSITFRTKDDSEFTYIQSPKKVKIKTNLPFSKVISDLKECGFREMKKGIINANSKSTYLYKGIEYGNSIVICEVSKGKDTKLTIYRVNQGINK